MVKLVNIPGAFQNNLIAIGRLPELKVCGHDHPTREGYAIRDHIHGMDLKDGCISALQKLFTSKNIGCTTHHLRSGHGSSMLETVTVSEKASSKNCIDVVSKRPGDATKVHVLHQACYTKPTSNNHPLGIREKPSQTMQRPVTQTSCER